MKGHVQHYRTHCSIDRKRHAFHYLNVMVITSLLTLRRLVQDEASGDPHFCPPMVVAGRETVTLSAHLRTFARHCDQSSDQDWVKVPTTQFFYSGEQTKNIQLVVKEQVIS